MKLVRATKGNFLFYLSTREKQLLLQVLHLYPRVPPAHHRVSKSPKSNEPTESQRLLDEALAEQRSENKTKLEAFLTDPPRFQQSGTGWRLSLSPSELEWLL